MSQRAGGLRNVWTAWRSMPLASRPRIQLDYSAGRGMVAANSLRTVNPGIRPGARSSPLYASASYGIVEQR